MTDAEVITTLKTLLQPINSRLDDIEIKIDTLKLDQKTSERAIRKDIHYLNDKVDTLIEVLEQKGILPKAN